MDSPMKFIVTTNADSADKMQKAGLQLVCNNGNFWEFFFDGKFKFDKLPNTKLTNKIMY